MLYKQIQNASCDLHTYRNSIHCWTESPTTRAVCDALPLLERGSVARPHHKNNMFSVVGRNGRVRIGSLIVSPNALQCEIEVYKKCFFFVGIHSGDKQVVFQNVTA